MNPGAAPISFSNPEDTRDWAWVAGASEGLGLAFASELARRGHPLMLFARRSERLRSAAEDLRKTHGVSVVCESLDLADPHLAERLAAHLTTEPPGIAVYNAAFVPVGDFLDRPLDELLNVVDVNVRGPVIWSRVLGEAMAQRRRGALVFMSSLAGEQGTPRLATYAASKSFNTILAEGLWAELRHRGVDVLACTAGAVQTPGYSDTATSDAPGILDADTIARTTLDRVGRGPRVAPGMLNGFAALLMGRWLPRRLAIALMQRNTRGLEATPVRVAQSG